MTSGSMSSSNGVHKSHSRRTSAQSSHFEPLRNPESQRSRPSSSSSSSSKGQTTPALATVPAPTSTGAGTLVVEQWEKSPSTNRTNPTDTARSSAGITHHRDAEARVHHDVGLKKSESSVKVVPSETSRSRSVRASITSSTAKAHVVTSHSKHSSDAIRDPATTKTSSFEARVVNRSGSLHPSSSSSSSASSRIRPKNAAYKGPRSASSTSSSSHQRPRGLNLHTHSRSSTSSSSSGPQKLAPGLMLGPPTKERHFHRRRIYKRVDPSPPSNERRKRVRAPIVFSSSFDSSELRARERARQLSSTSSSAARVTPAAAAAAAPRCTKRHMSSSSTSTSELSFKLRQKQLRKQVEEKGRAEGRGNYRYSVSSSSSRARNQANGPTSTMSRMKNKVLGKSDSKAPARRHRHRFAMITFTEMCGNPDIERDTSSSNSVISDGHQQLEDEADSISTSKAPPSTTSVSVSH